MTKPDAEPSGAWTVATRQDTPCTLDGFYAVGPLALGPPVAYVFGAGEAALIAAAPDLLEALNGMVEWYAQREGAPSPTDAILPADQQEPEARRAMAAIAKAEGRS